MPTFLAQIAPQRSTQYTALADALAPYELQLCPLAAGVSQIARRHLGGQGYLQFEMPLAPNDGEASELGALAMTSAYFQYYEQLGEQVGPFLRPIETHFVPAFSPELLMTRRYKGKTSEIFTHFLCNLARFSSAFNHTPWGQLRVFDPLAGGGTTLFAALMLGAEAAGVDHNTADVESTATFLEKYLQEEGIARTIREERLKKIGHRWIFTIGKELPRRLLLASGDSAQSKELIAGFKPHLIVTDLPYGIQHQGELVALLRQALPVWASLLQPGGILVFSWDATRFTRPEMISLVESVSPLVVLNQPPYDQLSHRVDRVIKRREVLVAQPNETNSSSVNKKGA